MTLDQEITGLIRALKCTRVTCFETGQWRFEFGERFVLDVFSPWRILSATAIEVGSADHTQKFGLPAPIDGVSVATLHLSASGIASGKIHENSGDIELEFESGLRFETLNDCSGYEAWTCHAGGVIISV